MADERRGSLPTNIEYQRLLMTQRVLLEKQQDASQALYDLLKSVFASKKELGLQFKDGFQVKLALDQMAEKKGGIDMLPKETRGEVTQKAAAVYAAVTARINQIKAVAGDPPELPKSDTEKNIEQLSEALQFNETQKELLLFFACSAKGRYQTLLDVAMPDKVASQEDILDGLALVLGKDAGGRKALEEELKPDNILLGVNFLGHDSQKNRYYIDTPLQRILDNRYETIDDFMVGLLGPNPQTELVTKDYAYMKDDLTDMFKTLKGYVENPATDEPKNMTIGGPPGTGKTQVTAILAKALKVPAFLVGVARKSETTGFSLDEPTRDDRIKALVRSAYILRKTGKKAVLVFDEAEDVLRDLNRDSTKESGSKAFINELLENLGVPTIFISNRTDLFDPATTRRILPYYGMDYMPFEARVGTIIAKAKKYIGADLTHQDVERLSTLAAELSVAIIDSSISAAGQRKPDPKNKEVVLKEIEREFQRALKAQNGGIEPVPMREPLNPDTFHTTLISANQDIDRMHGAITNRPDRWAGTPIAVIGKSGTGRTSVAEHLLTATGKKPRVVKLNHAALKQMPEHAHADDIGRSKLDGIPLVFEDATPLLLDKDHPFMQRVRAHSLPTAFVGDLPHPDVPPEMVEEALSRLSFVVRTGTLSRAQIQEAFEKLLNIEVDTHDIRKLQDVTIRSIITVQQQLEALGLEGNKQEALKLLEGMSERMREPRSDRGSMAFADMVKEREAAAGKRTAGD